jgi:hypothetical protein
MRLIDADALKEKLAKEGRLGDIVFDLDAAPTVSCEECGQDDTCSHLVEYLGHGCWSIIDACDAFERRQR